MAASFHVPGNEFGLLKDAQVARDRWLRALKNRAKLASGTSALFVKVGQHAPARGVAKCVKGSIERVSVLDCHLQTRAVASILDWWNARTVRGATITHCAIVNPVSIKR